MVILNNKNYKYDKAVIQSATYQLLRQKLKREIEIDFASSKVAAYEVFVAKKYRYTLCSKSTIPKEHLECKFFSFSIVSSVLADNDCISSKNSIGSKIPVFLLITLFL